MSRGFWLSALCLVSHSALATPPAAPRKKERREVWCATASYRCGAVAAPQADRRAAPTTKSSPKHAARSKPARSNPEKRRIHDCRTGRSHPSETGSTRRSCLAGHDLRRNRGMQRQDATVFRGFQRSTIRRRGRAAIPVLSWRERQTIQLGLALCLSRRGDHARAVSLYQRLLIGDGQTSACCIDWVIRCLPRADR